MAGLTHAGISLAVKRYAPTIPLTILFIAAYAIDIIWGILFAIGIERYPTELPTTANPWSHGFVSAVFWSVLFGFIAGKVSRNNTTGVIIGTLVFSHWVIDFISHPMRIAFPLDTGLPLLLDGSPLVGLGLWSYEPIMYLGEYGVFLTGIFIYFISKKKRSENSRRKPMDKN